MADVAWVIRLYDDAGVANGSSFFPEAYSLV